MEELTRKFWIRTFARSKPGAGLKLWRPVQHLYPLEVESTGPGGGMM